MHSIHCLVCASPHSALIAVIIVWKDELLGAQPIRPFHLASQNPVMVSGKSASLTVAVLYTTTRALPVMPVHKLDGDLAQSGTRALISVLPSSEVVVFVSIDSLIGCNMFSTEPIAPGS